MDIENLVEPIVGLAVAAGKAILEVYATDFDVQSKDDQSPVTQADLAAHSIICGGLGDLVPKLPIISEEAGLPDFAERRSWKRYWLVDPLDGTREFVKRNGEFTVNIALVERHRPILGVVHAPTSGVSYTGCRGLGATRRVAGAAPLPIRVAQRSATPPRIMGSRSHRGKSLEAFLARIGEFELQPLGSSLKFCRIARGVADIYPRLGPTSEWDTAAAQAVVEQAGGKVLELDGAPLSYNRKADILNPDFLVFGPADRDWLGMLAS